MIIYRRNSLDLEEIFTAIVVWLEFLVNNELTCDY